MKKIFLGFVALTFAAATIPSSAQRVDLEKFEAQAEKKWGRAIEKLEALDQSEKHPDDSILFIGSSSIRLWDEIANDMEPYHPIRRGFGGATWSDVAVFADRLIKPHKFQALVCFVANDIKGNQADKSPEEIVALFSNVWSKARVHQPDAPIFYIAVTPTKARAAIWPEIQKSNTAIRKFCVSKPNTYFIGTQSIYLDANGEARTELFIDDQHHLNRDGYIRWAAAIKSHLDSVLKQ